MKENKEKVYQHYIRATDKAVSVLEDSFKAEKLDPSSTFVRVGAKPGGCSGWKWTLESTDEIKLSDLSYENGKVLVNKDLMENVIGSITIDYRDDNLVEQGFVFISNSGQCRGSGHRGFHSHP